MRKNKPIPKKPKNLEYKKLLANHILKAWDKKEFHKHPLGTYWKGIFKNSDKELYIYFQYYARKRHIIDYIKIYDNKSNLRALTTKEILNLCKEEKIIYFE